MAALQDAGFDTDAPDDLLDWARSADRRLVLHTVATQGDWELLADLCQVGSNLVVVALLDEPSVASYVRAISAGAAGAMLRAATRSELRAVFRAAMKGNTLLPTEVVRALSSRNNEDTLRTDQPTPRELGWLRDLANGVKVGRLADNSGYSERMMFRLLRDLYTRLGVTSRTEALILAKGREWI